MLTERELEVIQRRAKGESQREIAKALKITQAAVSQFETNAHRKLILAEEMREKLSKIGVRTEETFGGKKIRYRGGRK